VQLPGAFIVNIVDGSLFNWRFIMSAQRNALRRSRSDRMFAGVCGGLGEFFGISPSWFRLAFLIALIPGGVPGLLVYGLMWLIVPSA
jgi:phage shock protein C